MYRDPIGDFFVKESLDRDPWQTKYSRMTQLSDKWAKLDNLGSLKALLISVHECNLLQLKQALAKKQLSSSDSLAHFDILDSRPNSSDRQDVQLYTSMISAGWSHGRTARAPSSLEASARRVVWSARRNL